VISSQGWGLFRRNLSRSLCQASKTSFGSESANRKVTKTGTSPCCQCGSLCTVFSMSPLGSKNFTTPREERGDSSPQSKNWAAYLLRDKHLIFLPSVALTSFPSKSSRFISTHFHSLCSQEREKRRCVSTGCHFQSLFPMFCGFTFGHELKRFL